MGVSYTSPVTRSESWRPLHLATVVGGFLLVRVVLFIGGLHFTTSSRGQIHLLDLGVLRADPFVAFTDLHIQPPLFNFFVGSVLRWSPFPAGISFQVLYLAMGLVTVVALYALLLALGARGWIATVATVLVAWSPLAIRNEVSLTYETPTSMILVVSALALCRYLGRPSTLRLALFAATLVAGILTRTTLNPIWFLGAIVLVVLARPVGRAWRPTVAVIGIAVALAAAPAVHNTVRFDSPGYSSFLGMNLFRATVLQLPEATRDRMIDDGRLSRAALVRPYGFYDDYADVFGRCDPRTGSPALDDVVKETSGDRNLNSVCYLRVHRNARAEAFAALRTDPGAYARSVVGSAVSFVRWDLHTANPYNDWWRRWEVGLYAPLTVPVPVPSIMPSGDVQPYTEKMLGLVQLNRVSLTVTFGVVLALVYGIRSLLRIRRRNADGADWTRLYIAWTVVSIATVGILFDVFENARFREPLDPLLLGPVYVLGLEGVRRVVVTLRSRRSSDVVAE